MLKESKGFNGDLKPEHEKTTNMITMDQITGIDSQASNLPQINKKGVFI